MRAFMIGCALMALWPLAGCEEQRRSTTPHTQGKTAVESPPKETVQPAATPDQPRPSKQENQPGLERDEAPPSSKTTQVRAPKLAADLWRSWEGKYVLYAHRSAGIRTLSDLAGKSITCAYINTSREPWVCDNILDDMRRLQRAGQIPVAIGIQNNPTAFKKRLLEDEDEIGFMSAGVADHFKLAGEEKLVQLQLVE